MLIGRPPASPSLSLSAAAIKDGAARKKLLKPIKLFPGNLVHPQQKEYTLMAALARGHPIACGIW